MFSGISFNAGDDYSGVPVNITFAANSVAGEQVCIDITAMADAVLEDDVEDLVLVLSTNQDRVMLRTGYNTTTVSITDVNSELGVMVSITASSPCICRCHCLPG